MINLDWFIGFLEGEGTFGVLIKKGYYTLGYYMQPKFKINLMEDDKKVLFEIWIFLKKNGIIFPKPYPIKIHKSWSENASGQYVLISLNSQACLKLYNLINGRLHTKKKREIEIWEKIVRGIIDNKHLTKKGFVDLMEFVDELRSLRKSRNKVIYNQEYFKSKWRM